MTVCRHCHTRPVNRSRGLCWKCFYTPGVRALYPSTSKYAPNAAKTGGGEPTEAELDLLIEEQRKALPPWWERAAAED